MGIVKKLSTTDSTTVFVKGLIYGQPGIGKTALVATAPKALMLLAEPEISKPTMHMLKVEMGIDLDYIEVETGKDLDEAMLYAIAHHQEYETLILDGITAVNNIFITEATAEGIKNTKTRDRNDSKTEIGEWGIVHAKTTNFLVALRNLPIHFLATALSDDIKAGAIDKTIPLIYPKKIRHQLISYFNMCGYLDASLPAPNSQQKRTLFIDPTIQYVGRNPGNALPAKIIDPNMTDIFQTITQKLKGDTN